MKTISCLLTFFLFLSYGFGQVPKTIGVSREWKSRSNTTVKGSITSIADGKVTLTLSSGKSVAVPYNQFSDQDALYIKEVVSKDFNSHIAESLNELKAGNGIPEVFRAAETVTLGAAKKTGKWSSVETGRWVIHSEFDLPKSVIHEIAVLLEGTSSVCGLVYPKFVASAKTKKLDFYLYKSVKSLESEDKDLAPGFSLSKSALLCVPEMIGLQEILGKWVFNPQADNFYLKEEICQLVMNRAGVSATVPYWVFYGLGTYVSKMPHRGELWFPAVVFEESRSPYFRAMVSKNIDQTIRMTPKQWNDPTKEELDGRTEATHHRHHRTAGSVVIGYLLQSPERKKKLHQMLEAAGSKSPPKKEALTNMVFGNGKIAKPIGAFMEQQTKAQPRLLSASTIAKPRVWKSSAGKTMNAELRGIEAGGKIQVVTEQNKRFSVPWNSFSPEDRVYTALNIQKMIDYGDIMQNLEQSQVSTKRRFPSKLDVPRDIAHIRFKKEESEKGRFSYETEHFKFLVIGKAPIKRESMSDLASWFEGTKELLEQSPFGVQASPVDSYYRAEVYDTMEGYHLGGGPRMSGGVYSSSKRRFLMPAKKTTLENRYDNDGFGNKQMALEYRQDTLVHEIVHMMMHDILRVMPKWSIEGTAEYVEHIPRRDGTFFHQEIDQGVLERSKVYQRWTKSLRLTDGTMSEPYPPIYDFGKLIKLSRKEWGDYVGDSSARQACMYQSSFLLTYYFMAAERERFLEFFEACRNGIPQWKVYGFELEKYQEAVEAFKELPGVNVRENGYYTYSRHLPHPVRPERPTQSANTDMLHVDILLNGRSPDQLNEVVTNWLVKKGIYLGRY